MMKIPSMKRIQKQLNKRLGQIGLDKTETDKRVLHRQKQLDGKSLSDKETSKRDHIVKRIVGSQADGTGFTHFNDSDYLLENTAVSCQLDDLQIDKEKVNFQMVCQTSTPGYVLLKLQNKGSTNNFKTIEDALIKLNGETYISSSRFRSENRSSLSENNGWIGKITEHKTPAGPSIPTWIKQNFQQKTILSMLRLKSFDMDVVNAFPCNNGTIIEEWRNRERKNSWPNKETIAEVAGLQAHVVPVGQRGCDNENLQWRICFTLGEIHLVQTFNEVQRKIFFLMKLIAKLFLKPICNDISSYVIKNVIFWISEDIPKEKFNKKNLIWSLQKALRYLLKSIERKSLRNYMIPQRNLFEGKFNDDAQTYRKLVAVVKRCINDPGKTIRELEPIFSECQHASMIDKVERKIMDPLTTKELATMYQKISKCKSEQDMQLLNILYKAIPFLTLYGTHRFSKEEIMKIESDIYVCLKTDKGTDKGQLDLGLDRATSAFKVWQRAMDKYKGYHGYGGLFLSYHVFVFLPHCCA